VGLVFLCFFVEFRNSFNLQVIILRSLELVPKMEGSVEPMVDLDVEPFHSTERIPFVSWWPCSQAMSVAS
jgi:hypothetical protein